MFIGGPLYVSLHYFWIGDCKFPDKRECLWLFEPLAQLNTNILCDYDDYQPEIIDAASLTLKKSFMQNCMSNVYTSSRMNKYKKSRHLGNNPGSQKTLLL